MGSVREDLESRAQQFAGRHGLQFVSELGFGVHGIVWAVSRPRGNTIETWALKAHQHLAAYEMERDVYLRLQDYEIEIIQNLNVPRLMDFDDALQIIGIGIVRPPYLLDFAGCHLDFPPDYSAEVIENWEAEKREQFGPRWCEVQSVLRELESYRIFLSDVTPNNLKFGNS